METDRRCGAILKAAMALRAGVMLLHANGIRGVVSADSIVMVDDEDAGATRPLLTCGLSRQGLSPSRSSSSSSVSGDVAAVASAAGAPELQEEGGEWTGATDIWVVGSLLHRAIYGGREPLLLPGKDCAELPGNNP